MDTAVVYLYVFLAIFMLFLMLLYLLSPLITPPPVSLIGQHVLVTGGSSGIGKAVAMEVVKRGGNVTLLARNMTRLSEAKAQVEEYVLDKNIQKVVCISVDLGRDYAAVEKAVSQAEEKQGPVLMLVNCAGFSISGRFEDVDISDFQKLMDVNYMGTVYATRAVIPGMKQRKQGRVVFVSSVAGVFGLFGFSAYSASKFALRGLAESLQMEVKPYNIRITLALPPDTDTPGYAHEMQTKPKETKLISEKAGLFPPSYVAKKIINDAIKGRFTSYVGLDGFVVSNATCGMSPITSITEALQQVVSMGLFRMILLFVIDGFDRLVTSCALEREKDEQIDSKSK